MLTLIDFFLRVKLHVFDVSETFLGEETRGFRKRQRRKERVESNRGEYFDKILGGSIYSTDLYQTMTNRILQ